MNLIDKTDKQLRKPPNRVSFPLDEQTKEEIIWMAMFMYDQRGVGLAANQVGIDKQIAIIDVDFPQTGKENFKILINPRIKEKDLETIEHSEGCLSIPGKTCKIPRSKNILIEYVNESGQLMELAAGENLLCYCIQHELDHLKGILITDYET